MILWGFSNSLQVSNWSSKCHLGYLMWSSVNSCWDCRRITFKAFPKYFSWDSSREFTWNELRVWSFKTISKDKAIICFENYFNNFFDNSLCEFFILFFQIRSKHISFKYSFNNYNGILFQNSRIHSTITFIISILSANSLWNSQAIHLSISLKITQEIPLEIIGLFLKVSLYLFWNSFRSALTT